MGGDGCRGIDGGMDCRRTGVSVLCCLWGKWWMLNNRYWYTARAWMCERAELCEARPAAGQLQLLWGGRMLEPQGKGGGMAWHSYHS